MEADTLDGKVPVPSPVPVSSTRPSRGGGRGQRTEGHAQRVEKKSHISTLTACPLLSQPSMVTTMGVPIVNLSSFILFYFFGC